jgi:orotidine-5'-phosphate decarboxylase
MIDIPRIFCAIDTPDLGQAVNLATQVNGLCGIKLGLTLFNKHGPQGIRQVIEQSGNKDLFLDLKFHDIPAQVAGAVKSIADLKPRFLTIHSSGGIEMMKAAKDACPPETKILAVTVLTSLDSDNLHSVGQDSNPESQVQRLASLAQQSGCDGVVCSSHEIQLVQKACGDDFITMVPGIRPVGSDQGDQKRVMTPQEAIAQGATHLVIGRPITSADNPKQAAKDILDNL